MPLSVAIDIATGAHTIECYFDKLEETLNIFDRASNIFNCDKIGLALAPKVVCTAETKAVSHLTSDTKSRLPCLFALVPQAILFHLLLFLIERH